MKRIIFVALTIIAFAGNVFSQGGVEIISEAIKQTVNHLSDRLPGNSRIIMSIDAENKKLADYIAEEFTINIFNSHLTLINEPLNNAETLRMIHLGRQNNANALVQVNVSVFNRIHRINITATDINSVETIALLAFNIDPEVDRMLASIVPAPIVQTMTFENESQSVSSGNGIYISLKYISNIPWAMVGWNFEIGGIHRNFFWSVDYGMGWLGINDMFMGGGASFGARIQPSERFQLIVGGSAGYWEAWYYYYYWWSSWGGGGFWAQDFYWDSFFGGPFVKLLWGNNRLWFELYERLLIGTAINSQLGLGITFAPSRKSRR